VDTGVKMKVVLEETEAAIDSPKPPPEGNLSKIEMPSFMKEMRGMKIGMVNMDDMDVSGWDIGETNPVKFQRVSELFEWKDLFPEWIDEEEEMDVPTCPEVTRVKYLIEIRGE
jgi:hypothetical protein